MTDNEWFEIRQKLDETCVRRITVQLVHGTDVFFCAPTLSADEIDAQVMARYETQDNGLPRNWVGT